MSDESLKTLGSMLVAMILVCCVVFTIISNVSVFFGNSKLIYTGKTKHIVKTAESNTFRVYSSVRTIKVN